MKLMTHHILSCSEPLNQRHMALRNRSGDIYQYLKYLKVLKNLAAAESRHAAN